MAKVAKIAMLLAVYLMWICGNSAIALSCHANESEHTHCCKSCECHHENCEKVHFEVPHGCHHDHSNTIALYDTVKKNDLNIEPVELSITAQISENLSIEDVISVRSSRYYERKVPIPTTPTISGSGLRAPPVIA